VISASLETVSDRSREMWVLRYRAELSPNEIASWGVRRGSGVVTTL